MNTFDGYIRRDGTNSKVLLDGGDVKALSSFIGTLSYNNNKITYTKADGNTSYDLVDLSAYNLVVATSDNLGGIKIGFSQSGKNYPVKLDSNNKAYVYVPWEANSHYTTNLYVGDGTAENKTTANGNTRIAVTDDNNIRNYITLIGTGATTVSSDDNGKITINTTYDIGTSAILNAGTNTEGKLWSAKTLVDYISDILGVDSTAITSLNKLVDQLHDNDTATGILVELAKKLNIPSSSIGSNKQPIYWNGSAFTTIGYTIEKSVPSNAVFTDTKYSFYVGENNNIKEHKNVSNPYFKLFENNTSTSIQIKAGTGISVNSDANGNITIKNEAPDQNHDTHYTTSMYVGENNDTKANKAVNSPYFKLFDNNTRRSTLRFVAGTGIGIVSDANGNITITNNSPDQNHNTDKTGIKLGTISGTNKTDSTLIINNSSTGLTIAGGTNKFSIGDGTNYIEVPITPSFTVSNKDATIGTSLTTIATIAGTDIKAKIGSYLPLSGGTLTGELISQNGGIWVQGGSSAGGNIGRMELVNGMPINLAFRTSKRGVRIYSNAIAFADPYNGNPNSDSGWVRHIEEIANRGILEIAVGDDGNEEIRFRRYNTSSNIVSDVLVPNTTGTLALTSQIPTDNNQLTNGAGYLTSHYVTGLYIGATKAKANAATNNGNTYLKLFDNDTKRTQFKISGTQNILVSSDASGNITITGPDLSGLAVTSNYYTKSEIDNKLSSILEIKIVTALPTSNINTKAIYLMSSTNTGTNDLYKEYVYINKGTESSPNWDWETLGEVKLDYSNLVTSIGITNQQLTWSKGGVTQTAINIDAKSLLGAGINSTFGGISYVKGDGVMEIGKYIDFHTSSNDTRDYAVRLQVNNDSGSYIQFLPAKTGTIALTSDLSNYLPLSGGVISNDNWGSQLTLKRNGGTPSLYFDDGTYKYWIYPQIGENKFGLILGNNTNGSEISKKVAFITDIPTKTSQLTNDSGYLVNAIRTYPGTDVDPSSTHSYWAAMTQKSGITKNYWHILHMDWMGGANWRSELALPTDRRTGVYYRTDSGDGTNWTFNNWIKLLDTSNSYISNGTITINGASITPLTSHQSLANYLPLSGGTLIGDIVLHDDVAFIWSPNFINYTRIPFRIQDGNYFTGINLYNSQGTVYTKLGIFTDKYGKGNDTNSIFLYPDSAPKIGTNTIYHSGNLSVSKSGETLTVNIGGISQSITNTWRGIQNNLTSNSTTDSLSAAQGKILNDKFINYHPLNGKITIAGGTYSWMNIQQYDSSNNNPSYYKSSCAIININSYTGWQPWIRCVDIENGSWALGQYQNFVTLIRFTKDNTSNYPGTYNWTFNADGSFTASKFIGTLQGNCTGSAGSVAWKNVSEKPTSYPVLVNQNITDNNDYPLIWTGNRSTANAVAPQLEKSADNLLYNPYSNRLKRVGLEGTLYGELLRQADVETVSTARYVYVKLGTFDYNSFGTLCVRFDGFAFLDELYINYGSGNATAPLVCGWYASNSMHVIEIDIVYGTSWSGNCELWLRVLQNTTLYISVFKAIRGNGFTVNTATNWSATTTSPTFNKRIPLIRGMFGDLSGNASSASKLTTNAGSATQPVYFSNGVPTACSYQLNKTVPSDAVFTDTHVTQRLNANNGNYPILSSAVSIADTTTDVTAIVLRNNSIYANPSTGTITANKFNGSSTHAETSSQSGTVAINANVNSYWGKLWEIDATKYSKSDRDVTFLLQSAQNSIQGTLHVQIRQEGANDSGAYNLLCSMRLTSGNIPKNRLRLYYNNSTGNCQLWYDCTSRYGVINAKILHKTSRCGTELQSMGTLYTLITTTEQTLPGTGYEYVEPTYAVISEWNNVQNKPSSYPVQLKQDVSTNVNYPLVWTTSASDADGPQSVLYKSFNKLLYNPSRNWLKSGALELYPQEELGYATGIRIHSIPSGVASLVFCGTDNTGTSGTSANSWFFGTVKGNIYLNRNGDDGPSAFRLWGHSNGYTIGNTTENSYNFTVGGTSRFIGTTTTSQIVPASSNTYSIGSSTVEYANTFSRIVWARHLNASGPFSADKDLYLGYHSTTNIQFYITDANGNNRRRIAQFKQDGNAAFDNTVTAASFYSSSDIRLKNIISNPIYKAEDFANLDLVKYTWKGKDDKIHLGSIAQSVEKEFPELVNTNQDGYKSLDYSVLGVVGIISLAKEIIELKEEIKKLKSKLYG